MKKLLLILLFACLSAPHFLHAQCTPDLTITQSGIYPDSLPPATVGVSYSEVLQVRVPADTLGFPIVHVSIDNVLGLPSGFMYQCVPNNCVFPGGGNGCIVFSGTAPAGGGGQYPLQVIITTKMIIFTEVYQTDTLNDYIFIITDPLSVNNANSKSIEIQQNYPNPATTKTSIDFIVPKSGTAELSIFNVLGKQILNKKYNAKPGKNSIELDVREFEDGIYMYTIKTGNTVMTRRMVISKKQ